MEGVLQQYGFHSSGFRFLTLVVPRRPNHDEVPEITRSKVVGYKVGIFVVIILLIYLTTLTDEIQCKTIYKHIHSKLIYILYYLYIIHYVSQCLAGSSNY